MRVKVWRLASSYWWHITKLLLQKCAVHVRPQFERSSPKLAHATSGAKILGLGGVLFFQPLVRKGENNMRDLVLEVPPDFIDIHRVSRSSLPYFCSRIFPFALNEHFLYNGRIFFRHCGKGRHTHFKKSARLRTKSSSESSASLKNSLT